MLLGDSSARNIRSMVESSLRTNLSSGTFRTLADVGITTSRNGQITLDEAKLKAAILEDPAAVGALFARSGEATSAAVSFGAATEATKPGTYAVNVTQSAARAQTTGNVLATLGGDETLQFTLGSKNLAVALTNGQTAASIVTTLNNAFRANNLALAADVDDDGALRVRSDSYGSNVVLKVESSRVGADASGLAGDTADTESEFTGEDVAGTIDGTEALGNGLNLTASSGDAKGLRLQVAAGTIGDLGTLTYAGGVAGSLLRSLGLTGGADALVTSATQSLSSGKDELAKRIADYETRLTSTEARIRRQFSTMENMLNNLKAQQSRLASALQTLPTSA